MTNKSRRKLFFLLFSLLALLPAPSPAQPPATTQPQAEQTRYIYEKPTRQKFSRLYWALGIPDLKNDVHVDNYLMINECDIYRDYYHNEFEWKEVRESARKFITENKTRFPLRFEVMQPLRFGEYHLDTKRFDILPEFQMTETTRLEVFPVDYDKSICIDDRTNRVEKLEGYPIGVIANLNRPLNLISIPTSEALSRQYINQKMQAFKKLPIEQQTQKNLYALRDGYISFKIKFFSFKSQAQDNTSGFIMAEIMGVLEGVEVYADKEKKILLWSQDFSRRKHKSLPVAPAPNAHKLELPEKSPPK